MAYKSDLRSPNTNGSGEVSGCDGPRGQVVAAYDDDDMEWLDVEKIQYPESDEDRAE